MKATFASCVSGRPPTTLTARGEKLVRFDVIERFDGTYWRYEGLGCDNTVVLASSTDSPGEIRRFPMEGFWIRMVTRSA